jgi:hypothetical protein
MNPSLSPATTIGAPVVGLSITASDDIAAL